MTDGSDRPTAKVSADAFAALACPRCGGPLDAADSLACSRCGIAYSFVGHLPCLVPDPSFWRARMVQRLDEYLEFTAGRIAALQLEIAQYGSEMLPRTTKRLGRIIDGMKSDRALIETTLSPVRAGALALPGPGALSGAPAAGTLALLSCYENVFRDWAWGDAESAGALRIVQRLVSEGKLGRAPGRLAIFGAGAGRLAVDVHQALGPAQTLALDLNPVPLLIADRLVRGEIIEASEFPVAPRGEADVTVARRLHCPFSVRAGLTFLLADGLSPPFAPGSLDVVITPWFIDVVEADPRVTAAIISRVLKPGGLWLNFGPLRFNGPTSRLYMIEEVVDIVSASGFEMNAEVREQVPYFASPESGFQRLETVYAFAAQKTSEAPMPLVPETEPAWIVDPHAPVPALPEWASIQKSASVAGAVFSMIDGQTTIAEMADALGQLWGVDPRALDGQLQAFLVRLLPR